MTNLQLFDLAPAGRARHHDPVTSLSAARRQRTSVRAAILQVFAAGVELTDDELVARVDGLGSTVKTARSALAHDGLLVWTGVSRPGLVTGSPQNVWTLTKGDEMTNNQQEKVVPAPIFARDEYQSIWDQAADSLWASLELSE